MKSSHKKMKVISITKSDIKIFSCVIIFAISVALKYANTDNAQNIRNIATNLLHGGTNTSEVIAVVGEAVNTDEIVSVFNKTSENEQEINSVFYANEESETQLEVDTEMQNTVISIESGYAEDLEDRDQTLFPKVSDETAYIMNFEHISPLTEATLTSDFGVRIHPITEVESFHYGIDLAAPKDMPIYTIADGVVRETGDGSYGNYIIIDHDDGFSTLYAHCETLISQKGDNVAIGEQIATVGSTGNSTGNHLHFEVWKDGKALNPSHYTAYK